jgi:tripartite-type tricarboxylate transporter receptor subunit TctC
MESGTPLARLHHRRREVLSLGLAGLLGGGAGPVRDYPNQTVRIVAQYAPGGANDLLARLVAQGLTSSLSKTFVVDGRAGAGGNIGAEYVARAAPDGYTLLMGSGSVAINQTLYKRLPFDALKSFSPVTLVGMVPNVLAVNPKLPVRSVDEFIAYARRQPDGISYGSAGIGSVPHLTMVLFLKALGLKGVHIPYRGSAPAITDLISGRIDAVFENLPPLSEHLRTGVIRGLCVSSAVRFPGFPDMPTVAEAASLPGFDVTAWQSLMAPAGTPPEIVSFLAEEVAKALGSDAMRSRIQDLGAIPRFVTPQAFEAFLQAEVVKWAEAVRTSGASVD